jgi:iron complex transport system substrate-binding protein
MDRSGAFEEAKRQWMKWTLIPAVKHGRVHLLDSDLIGRPSPRIVRGLEILARYIHPEAGWND